MMMLLCTVMSAAGAAHPCLTLSVDGSTVTDANGCTVLTAADWGTATRIADEMATSNVFKNSKDTLTSIEFPSNFQYIGSNAFFGCSKITGSLTIPDSVTTINSGAFSGCSGFTGDLTIGNSVTRISQSAFFGCSGFRGNLTIGSSVKIIDDAAFRDCTGFTGALVIPDSVEYIGNQAFANCSGFTGSLSIPDSVTNIGTSAFSGCSGFTGDLTIGNSVTTIGTSAFAGCAGFTGGLTIPNSVNYIGQAAFARLSNFSGFLLTSKTTTVDVAAFMQAAPVYMYSDAAGKNSYGATDVYFIDSISVEPQSITLDVNDSGVINISSDKPGSNAYIPSISYSSSNASISVPQLASTGKGVMTNTINGIADGTSTITITAAQVGSDIFGAANVPAIPSITIPVTVTGSNIPTTGGDGGSTGVSENQNSPDLSHYEPAVYAAPEITANGNTSLTITNTHYPELINVTVVKYWTDDDNRDYLRPEAICLTLTAAADSVSEDVWNHTLNASNADVNDNNKWQYVFEDLVKFYDGYQIAYTLGEASGECTNQVTKTIANCEISGGKWENNACTPFSLYDPNSQHGSEPAEYNDQASCEAASHTWMSAFCSDNSYSTQEDCANAGETWNEGRCAVN